MKPGPNLVNSFAVLASVVLASGCAVNRYRAPITGFQTASATAIATARTYYLASNKAERDHFIDDHAATHDAIDPTELQKTSTTFSAEDIEARIEALGVLSDYTSLLLSLATSDAPAQAATQVEAVETEVNKLAARAGKLCTGSQCTASNKSFQAAVSNLSGVIQPILRGLLTRKIERGLDKSIQNAEKPVGDLIDAVRADMAGFQARREQAFSLKLSTATSRYNNEAKKATPDLDELARLADRIKTISDQRDELSRSNPDRALLAMNRAHIALVQFSKRDKSPSNITELAEAVNAFAAEAQLAGSALRALLGI